MSTPVPTGKKEKGSAPNPSSGSGQPSAAKDPSPQPAQPQDKAGMQRNSSAKDLTKLPNKSESKLTPSNSYNQLPSPAAPAGKKDKKEAAAPPAAPPAAKPAETETKTELGKKRATFHPDIPLNEKAPPPLRDFLEQKIPTLVSVGSKQHLQSATEFMIDVVFESDYDDGTTSGAPAAVTHNEDEDEGVDENNFALYDIKDADENNDAAAAEVEEIAHEADEAEMRVLVEEPFYVVDLALVARKYTQWTRLFPRIVPHYAIKCNPDLGVVTTLAWLKAGFDCASKAEIQLALSQNVELNRIIFANPCKAIPELKYAKEVGVTQMTFDNAEELRKIKEHYPEGKLLLRIRTEDSHSTIPLGKKFGCELRDVEMLLKLCHQLQLTLIGVSFHVGSGCYDVDAYPEALKNAKSVFDMAKSLFGWNLSLLDIGGGFPGTNDDKVTIEMIAKAVNPLIDELFPASTGVRIVSEPGRYFVEASHTLCVEVIGKYDMLTNTMQRNRTTELDSEVSSIAGSVAGSVATSIATSIASSIRNRQGGWGVARPNQPIMKKTLDGGDHTPSSRTVHSIKIDSFAAGSPANVNKAAHTKFDALPSLSLPPQSNEITLTKTPAPSASPTNPDSPKHPSGLHVSPRGSPFSKPIGSPFASPNLSSRKLPSSFPSPHIGLSNSPHLGSVNVAGMGTIVNGMPLPIAPEDLPTDRLPRSSAPAQSLDPAAPAASATDSASGPTLSSGPSAAGANDQVRFVYYINEGVYGSFKDRVLLQETFNPNVLWCKRLTDALAAPRKESVTHMKSLLPIPTKKPDTLTVGSSATPAPAAPAAPSAPAAAEPAVLDGGDLELEIALRNMPHFKSRILGPTTHPLDVICPSVNLPELDVGDWLYFTRMGAYTISLASCFNGYEKPNTLYIWTDQEDEEIKVELDAQGKKVLLAALDRKRKVKKIRRGMKRRMVRIRKKKVTKKKGKPTKKKRNRIPQ